MKIVVTSFRRCRACPATLTAPDPAAASTDPRPCWRHGHSLTSLGSLLWDHCSSFLDPGAKRFCLHPPRVYFPVLYKLWHLYGAVNGNLLHEGLSHTQVCSTQSPCPFGSPLLTHMSTGDAQTQFCLSLWVPGSGVPGCWCTQGLF